MQDKDLALRRALELVPASEERFSALDHLDNLTGIRSLLTPSKTLHQLRGCQPSALELSLSAQDEHLDRRLRRGRDQSRRPRRGAAHQPHALQALYGLGNPSRR